MNITWLHLRQLILTEALLWILDGPTYCTSEEKSIINPFLVTALKLPRLCELSGKYFYLTQ